MKIIRIATLKNNYIWLIYDKYKKCILIDPGESKKTIETIKKFQFNLIAILLTHYHDDHVNGVNELLKNFPKITVYGPSETKKKGVTNIIQQGDTFTLLKKKFQVLDLSGHTPKHVGFYTIPWLFCGDTVFSAGCGKITQGLEQKMHKTFHIIKTLPTNTLIFSGHEYTLSNINFAYSILPKDKYIVKYRKKIIKLRKYNQPTVPTTLKLELKINLFFRCHQKKLQTAINYFPVAEKEEWKVFSELRRKKDIFNKKT